MTRNLFRKKRNSLVLHLSLMAATKHQLCHEAKPWLFVVVDVRGCCCCRSKPMVDDEDYFCCYEVREEEAARLLHKREIKDWEMADC